MDIRYPDPKCSCRWSIQDGRIWCEHCRTDGPLPGSFADPDWEIRRHDPAVLREAASRLDDSDPGEAEFLRAVADQLAEHAS